MIYVVSDIHGRYEEYKKLLETIRFSEQDSLFILGDIVDRGDYSMELLQDIMFRPNVYTIAGNHDLIALACLKELTKELTEDFIDRLDRATLEMVLDWLNNLGGNMTLSSFKKINSENQRLVLEYIEELELYDEIKVNGNTYVLAHTLGLNNFEPNKPLYEYSAEDLLDTRCDYGFSYYPDKILITGHTPTHFIEENQFKNSIYKGFNHIAIDCGMEHLACICLDSLEEFYISI